MDIKIEQAAAMALLDRGAAFHIPAPFLFRVFGKKKIKIVVKQLRLGSLIHLTDIPGMDKLKELPVGEDAKKIIEATGSLAISISKEVLEKSIWKTVKAVAACLLNSPLRIKLFKYPLAAYLKSVMTSVQLQELVMWLIIYGRLEPFMSTIKLLTMMRVTSPMNLSHEEKRS